MPAKGVATVGQPDVVVVGGGVIGVATAWRAAQRGLVVTVVDPEPGRGASYAAAGMLAPVTEAHYGEEGLLALNLAGAARYPVFVEELGTDVGYTTSGTLAVALDVNDRAMLADLHTYQQRVGLHSTVLSGRECREFEPMLAPGVRGGLLVTNDHAVDPRRLTARLLSLAQGAGVRVVVDRVAELVRNGDRVSGVRLGNADVLPAGTVVVAAGCWSGRLVPELPVRPVKGHILRLHGPGLSSRVVRGVVQGRSVYLVPRPDGEVVVGATVEEMGFDTTVRAGGVHELLRDAHALVPGITELALVETLAGLRPGTPDNAPLVGPWCDGLVVATGHYRNGILLAPVTADAVAELLATGRLPVVMAPFEPHRMLTGASA